MATSAIDYAAALVAQNSLLADAFSGADLASAVPTCPGWSMLQLMRHVGRGDRWAAQMIREDVDELDVRAVVDGRPPDDVNLALDWLRASAALVVAAVAAKGPGSLVPTFLGRRPGTWWLRRRLHEATVHRADASLARADASDFSPYSLEPHLAADGLDEWLERVIESVEQGSMSSPLRPGRQLALRCTDLTWGPELWALQGTDGGVIRIDATAIAAATLLEGRAEDIFLSLVRRRRIEQTEVLVDGDITVWQDWLASTPL